MIKYCLELGYAPICTFPKKGGGVSNVMFGPLTDHSNHKPIPLGTIFPATKLYTIFGLKHHDIQSDVWSGNVELINALIFRRPEKNFLYLPNVDESNLDYKESVTHDRLFDGLADFDHAEDSVFMVREAVPLFQGITLLVQIPLLVEITHGLNILKI